MSVPGIPPTVLQPERPTWTLVGQSSIHVFRVIVHTEKDSSGQVVYRFEHPTRAGQQSGGWATRLAAKVKSAGYGEINPASYYYAAEHDEDEE